MANKSTKTSQATYRRNKKAKKGFMTKKVVASVVNNEEIVTSKHRKCGVLVHGEVPSRKCRLFVRFTFYKQ